MSTITWPAGLPTGTVNARFADVHGEESGRVPGLTALAGEVVTIEAEADVIGWTGAASLIGLPRVIQGVIDDQGWLCDAVGYGEAGPRGLILPASDSDMVTPRGFAWRATLRGHTWRFTLYPGQVLNLAAVATTETMRASVSVVDASTAHRAELAADRAEAAVEQIIGQGGVGEGVIVPVTTDGDGDWRIGAGGHLEALKPDGTMPSVLEAQVRGMLPRGIEEVSGTVALGNGGPRIRELYTVEAATIEGVPIPADTAVVWRRDAAGAWSYRTVTQWVAA